jgi:hypothetical protein
MILTCDRLNDPSVLDTSEPSEILHFVDHRREPVVVLIPALRVIEHFYVIEYVLPSFLPRMVDTSPYSFPFQQLKKALSHSIIVAVSASAHAGLKIAGLQELLPVIAAKLASIVDAAAVFRMSRFSVTRLNSPLSLHIYAFWP